MSRDFTLRVGDDPERSLPRTLRMESLLNQDPREYKMEFLEERCHAVRKLADNLAVMNLLPTQKPNREEIRGFTDGLVEEM